MTGGTKRDRSPDQPTPEKEKRGKTEEDKSAGDTESATLKKAKSSRASRRGDRPAEAEEKKSDEVRINELTRTFNVVHESHVRQSSRINELSKNVEKNMESINARMELLEKQIRTRATLAGELAKSPSPPVAKPPNNASGAMQMTKPDVPGCDQVPKPLLHDNDEHS